MKFERQSCQKSILVFFEFFVFVNTKNGQQYKHNDVDVAVNELQPHQQPRYLPPDMFFLDLLDPSEVTDLKIHLEE